jgi:O-antigen/teichoic acid export membrane protein
LLVILGFSLFGAVIAVVISSIVTFFFILNYALRKYRFLFSSKVRVDTDRIVRFILFTALLSVPATIYANVDMVMIGYFLSSEDVAYYRAGFSIVGAVLGLISVPTVLMPVFVKLEGEDLSRAFARAFKYSSALCIPSAFGLGLISQNLLIFAYGDEYLPGLLALQVLSVLLISPAFGIYGSVFSGKERPDLYFYPVMVSMILNVILNYLLIPILGIAGAAIATVLSHIFYWFVLAYIGLREFELRPQLGYIAKPLLCAILMFLVARNFNSMLLIVPLSIVVYSAALLAIRGITREDIDFIRKIGGV